MQTPTTKRSAGFDPATKKVETIGLGTDVAPEAVVKTAASKDGAHGGTRGSPMILLPFCRTAVSAVRVCFLAAGLDCGVVVEGGRI